MEILPSRSSLAKRPSRTAWKSQRGILCPAGAGGHPAHHRPGSPETFIQTFERLTENGDQVLAILISSAMSGTYQSAMIAQGIVDESNIAVVDAQTVTFGMGLWWRPPVCSGTRGSPCPS